MPHGQRQLQAISIPHSVTIENCETDCDSNRSILDIPSELWAKIFCLLPVKTLLCLITVCKTWKSIIEDPEFASLHINRCPDNLLKSHLIVCETICEEAFSYPEWLLRSNTTFSLASELEFPTDEGLPLLSNWYTRGSVNGLLLLQRGTSNWDRDDIILWNPSIRKSLALQPPPYSPIAYDSWISPFELSLGFDSSCHDYNVVLIVHPGGTTRNPIRQPSVEIFSLKDRSWNSLEDTAASGIRCVESIGWNKLSFGSSLHWIGKEYSPFTGKKEELIPRRLFVSFNLKSKKFSYDPLPVLTHTLPIPMVVDGSCVGLWTQNTIWVLETSASSSAAGEAPSKNWSKRYNLTPLYPDNHCAVFCPRDEIILLHRILLTNVVYSFNPSTGTEKLISESYPFYAVYMEAYVESLVLLKQGM